MCVCVCVWGGVGARVCVSIDWSLTTTVSLVTFISIVLVSMKKHSTIEDRARRIRPLSAIINTLSGSL